MRAWLELSRLALLGTSWVIALALGGCAEPTTLASASITAAEVGSEAIRKGRIESAVVATLEEVRRASQETMKDLGFELVQERALANEFYYGVFADDAGHLTRIRASLRTESIVVLTVKCGYFGEQSMTLLVHGHLIDHLKLLRSGGAGPRAEVAPAQ
jgi:hypothetical protein